MAWDTERTKRLLLDAATAEFSEHGLAGARVDRIAASAGVNKERIYQYFGKKDDLFAAVLATGSAARWTRCPCSASVPRPWATTPAGCSTITSPTASSRGSSSGRGSSAGRHRRRHRPRGVPRREGRAFRGCCPASTAPTAGELLLTIVSLVNAWPVLGHLDAFLVGTGPGRTAAPTRRDRRDRHGARAGRDRASTAAASAGRSAGSRHPRVVTAEIQGQP